MTALRMAVRQAGYEQRAFWRNPPAAFFTFAFPLLFMVIFNILFGRERSGQLTAGDFFTPALIVFGVITATYTNLAMMVTIARDEGVLKRIRGTPLPAGVYLAGRILSSVVVALLLVVIVMAFGVVFYGTPVPWDRLPALLATLAVAGAAFCALGLALTAAIPNADAAPAITNATILPLLFISNVFFNAEQAPGWLNDVSRLFPVRHFADAMLAIYDPRTTGSGFAPEHLLVIAAWGLAGLLMAARFFTWEPRR